MKVVEPSIFEEKKMKKLLLNLFFLVGLYPCFAQSSAKLEGTVRDAESGDPIAFGTVALFQNGVLVAGTETDFDGYYSITEIDPGEYKIEFATTGYKPVKVEKYSVLGGKANKLDMNLDSGIEIPHLCCSCYYPPMIEQDNTTQGHVFRQEEVRHSPIR